MLENLVAESVLVMGLVEQSVIIMSYDIFIHLAYSYKILYVWQQGNLELN